jgi:hypothetical protein
MSPLVAALVVAVLVAVGVAVRSLTRCPWVLADSYTHLYLGAEIRRRRSLELRLERFLYDASVPDALDYPPAFPLLLALLDPARPGRAIALNRWLPSLLDAAALVAASTCASVLSGWSAAGVVCAVLWLLAPCTHAQTIALSGRPLGAFVATITFSALAAASQGSWWAALLALGAGAVLVLTNRLAIQAWAVLGLGLAAARASFAPLVLLVASILLSGAATCGLGWRVHAGHWRHLRRLRRLMPKKRWHQLARVSAPRSAPPPARGLKLALRASIFIDFPWLWLVPALFLLGAPLPQAGIGWTCLVWIGSLAVAGAIIQAVPGLRFVGEGFRYLEYAIVPLAVLVARGAEAVRPEKRPALLAVSLMIAGVALLQMARNARASRLVGTCRDERAVALARRMQPAGPVRLLVLPLQYSGLVTVEAGAGTLMMLGEAGADRSEDFYPVMERPPAQFARTFALDGVFLDRRYAAIEELALPATLADEEGPFALYRLVEDPQ